ncbi:RNA polymerase sigma factor [Streptomyces glycanivorans]|uniref:Sigma-70 family RNA polymerase sigma factor n=2 Tax=Streptomyces TaxID=1883 RepID=A0ABY9JQM4_9ACTN|nr:sigma-70 family RNA polymerase sigma factor [Streptomyces sp. Alt3]WLQ69319.1 sigma-70 family RNA polymerase sigma factor [Streptomyces sp. Alt3]
MSTTSSPGEPDGPGAQYELPRSSFLEEINNLKGIEYRMTPDQEAFYDLYARAHLRYAHTMLGDKDAAKAVVRRCYSHLALNWANVLKQESPEAYAWKLLKQRVETHLRLGGQTSQMVQTAAFQQAARATLEMMRRQFAVMESALGLYTAIAGLPERQYDVIVMHYVLGYSSPKIARIMGIKPDTVRSHRRLARERIAIKLGLSPDSASDENEKE